MGTSTDDLCVAIRSRTVVQFYYTGDKSYGARTVEPHMIAQNAKGRWVLSGWFLGGASESQEGQGWREYILAAVTNVIPLKQGFQPRSDYNSTGGKQFHNVLCAI
jgi:hypothetical protein